MVRNRITQLQKCQLCNTYKIRTEDWESADIAFKQVVDRDGTEDGLTLHVWFCPDHDVDTDVKLVEAEMMAKRFIDKKLGGAEPMPEQLTITRSDDPRFLVDVRFPPPWKCGYLLAGEHTCG